MSDTQERLFLFYTCGCWPASGVITPTMPEQQKRTLEDTITSGLPPSPITTATPTTTTTTINQSIDRFIRS